MQYNGGIRHTKDTNRMGCGLAPGCLAHHRQCGFWYKGKNTMADWACHPTSFQLEKQESEGKKCCQCIGGNNIKITAFLAKSALI